MTTTTDDQPTQTPAVPATQPAMLSIVQDEYGSSPEDVLRLATVDRPAPADDEVLVRVHAASVDRGTWHIMAGLPRAIRVAGFGLRRPKARNPGRSVAGVVEAVGRDVTGLAVGDDVYGTVDGSFAEYATGSPQRLARMPANLSFEEAAAVPVSALAALQAVRDQARVHPGQDVLIIGASGGVGTFAIQLAKAHGARVTAVASTAKLDLVRSLGADQVLDYTREDFATGGPRFDAIVDIGGNSALSHLRRALTPRGRLVITGGETDGPWLGGSGRQIRAMLISPFVSQKLGTFVASENADDLVALRALIEAGKVAPAIDRVHELSETAAAIRHVQDGRARGKVVVRVR
jgi:NADPH:quinone reductase-like Zn-dependent oxidoreductase